MQIGSHSESDECQQYSHTRAHCVKNAESARAHNITRNDDRNNHGVAYISRTRPRIRHTRRQSRLRCLPVAESIAMT